MKSFGAWRTSKKKKNQLTILANCREKKSAATGVIECWNYAPATLRMNSTASRQALFNPCFYQTQSEHHPTFQCVVWQTFDFFFDKGTHDFPLILPQSYENFCCAVCWLYSTPPNKSGWLFFLSWARCICVLPLNFVKWQHTRLKTLHFKKFIWPEMVVLCSRR